MTGDADAPATAYEALRAHVLTGSTAGSHAGLVVLLRQGVAAWMARCSACSSPAPAAAHTATPLVGDEIHAAIVRVLASMALAGQQGVRRMSSEAHQKVIARHLRRNAYLYVRQSTMRQVFENTESTQRQYALRQRAVTLGWPNERVIVIDSDLGLSGTSATDRQGFQKLVAEVGLGRAGIVLGLEVSRLARNSADWHRLLEICALSDTLILDEDGVYDPAHFNDRLLLGLKGTMSEAELYVLRARLRGGILNKARRGELRCPLPVGFVHTGARVVLDPDKQIQDSVRLLFQTFARTGAASATVKYFRQQGLLFPTRVAAGARKGELSWVPLSVSRAANALHNPWYAGAYAYGRGRWRKQADGRTRHERLPKSEWHALIKDAHPGYISWEEHERIEQRLQESAKALAWERRQSPPREGPALLQGRAVCGLCGNRMHVHYNLRRGGQLVPNYVCFGRGRGFGDPACQSIVGTEIDAAVGKLLVEVVTPMALDLALAVQQEITARLDEMDRLRHRQVERAQYEADQARHRYMQVDPANRLVADSLEADWTPSCVPWARPKRTTSAGARPIASLSTRTSVSASSPSPRTFLPPGVTRIRRSASANGCSACSSRMLRSSSSGRSPPPSASGAAPPLR